MQLENLHHFSNLQDNFWFNYQSLAALVLCWRLTESDVTLTPSVCVWIDDDSNIITWVM